MGAGSRRLALATLLLYTFVVNVDEDEVAGLRAAARRDGPHQSHDGDAARQRRPYAKGQLALAMMTTANQTLLEAAEEQAVDSVS